MKELIVENIWFNALLRPTKTLKDPRFRLVGLKSYTILQNIIFKSASNFILIHKIRLLLLKFSSRTRTNMNYV